MFSDAEAYLQMPISPTEEIGPTVSVIQRVEPYFGSFVRVLDPSCDQSSLGLYLEMLVLCTLSERAFTQSTSFTWSKASSCAKDHPITTSQKVQWTTYLEPASLPKHGWKIPSDEPEPLQDSLERVVSLACKMITSSFHQVSSFAKDVHMTQLRNAASELLCQFCSHIFGIVI